MNSSAPVPPHVTCMPNLSPPPPIDRRPQMTLQSILPCCTPLSLRLPQAFEINDFKAWRMVLLTLASFGLGEFLIYNAPWYLLPLAWAWTGTAFTGVSHL